MPAPSSTAKAWATAEGGLMTASYRYTPPPSYPVVVPPGESRQVEIPVPNWNSSSATVRTVDETVTVNRSVAPPEFAVDIAETNTPVTVGQSLTVTALVENTGSIEGTQTLTLSAGALGENSTNVTLGSTESTERVLSVSTSEGDAGEYTATVSTDDDQTSRNVTVEGSANLTVVAIETNAPLAAGGALTVAVTVENSGAGTGSATLTVDAGPLGETSTSVTVAGDNSTTEQVTFDSETTQTGVFEVTAEMEATVSTGVELHPTPLPTGEGRPRDPDGDGLYENIDGEGGFTIFDVQTFFIQFQQNGVTQHAPAYNFDGSEDGEVSIFDVQSMFIELA